MIITIDPLPQALTVNEQRVKALLDQGKNQFQIAYQLHISFEAVREMIFSIRKKEAIILAKLSNQEKGDIYRSYKSGTTQAELAKRYGVTKSTICQIIQKLAKAECEVFGDSAADKPMQNTGINEDFEQAVDDMIAERKAAEAEKKLPEAVYRALLDKINDCDFEIEEREERIAELQAEIAEFRRIRDAIIEWKEPYERLQKGDKVCSK